MKDLHTEKKALLHRFSTNQLHNDEVYQVKQLLKQFLQRKLTQVDSQEIIDILVTNEQCMALFMQLWPNSFAALENETAQRLEHKIKREIQRLNRLEAKATQKESIKSRFKRGIRQVHPEITNWHTSHNKN